MAAHLSLSCQFQLTANSKHFNKCLLTAPIIGSYDNAGQIDKWTENEEASRINPFSTAAALMTPIVFISIPEKMFKSS